MVLSWSTYCSFMDTNSTVERPSFNLRKGMYRGIIRAEQPRERIATDVIKSLILDKNMDTKKYSSYLLQILPKTAATVLPFKFVNMNARCISLFLYKMAYAVASCRCRWLGIRHMHASHDSINFDTRPIDVVQSISTVVVVILRPYLLLHALFIGRPQKIRHTSLHVNVGTRDLRIITYERLQCAHCQRRQRRAPGIR